MILRDYQRVAVNGVHSAWDSGRRNVLVVLPTGAGKTVVFSHIIRGHRGAACAVAHRQELVTQISMALARDEVPHRIVGPKSVIKLAVGLHVEELGTSYYDPSARVAVAGVDTIIRRGDSIRQWANSVSLWVMDEAHHVLRENKWGKAVLMFPKARGLGVTATPMRADGRGLGRVADGYFDTLIEGPGMRDLIRRGYLTDYRVFAPPSDLDLSTVKIAASGDYARPGLVQAVERSHIIGDVVEHYRRIATGRLGVTFATDVATATQIAAQYNGAGVPAEVVHAKTPDRDRIAVLRRFRNRELLQLVNVDLFGEGFDLPAIEVVSMARPTQSYGLYAQQFGRALRPLPGKSEALIIDHVGNVMRHGLPDGYREWSLAARERRGPLGPTEPIRVCANCTAVYDRALLVCPYCEWKPEPQRRDGPEWVDGDLYELDAATLERLRGAVQAVDAPADPSRWSHLPYPARAANVRRHEEKQEAQAALRQCMQWWGGLQESRGRDMRAAWRLFYATFGLDVMTAQALGRADAEALAERITMDIGRIRV